MGFYIDTWKLNMCVWPLSARTDTQVAHSCWHIGPLAVFPYNKRTFPFFAPILVWTQDKLYTATIRHMSNMIRRSAVQYSRLATTGILCPNPCVYSTGQSDMSSMNNVWQPLLTYWTSVWPVKKNGQCDSLLSYPWPKKWTDPCPEVNSDM